MNSKVLINEKFNWNKRSYVFKEAIGHGGFGTVYLANEIVGEIETQQQYAIKAIKVKVHNKIKQFHVIKEEVEIMKQLSGSRYFVKYEDAAVLTHKHQMYYLIIMEYCNGGDFESYLRNVPGNKLSDEEAYSWFLELMKMVGTLIKNGVVHRDIKPHNLFLHYPENCTKPVIKLGDFGCGKRLFRSAGGTTSTFCGTTQYLAPEVFTGNYANTVDLWSICVILCRMVSNGNIKPFDDCARDRKKVYQNILEGKFKMPSNISPDLKDLFNGIFEPDLETRYTFPEVYSSAWCRRMRYKALPKVIKMREYLENKNIISSKDLPLFSQKSKEMKCINSIGKNGCVESTWGGNNCDDYELVVDTTKTTQDKEIITITYGLIHERVYNNNELLPLTLIPYYYALYRHVEAVDLFAPVMTVVITKNVFNADAIGTINNKFVVSKAGDFGFIDNNKIYYCNDEVLTDEDKILFNKFKYDYNSGKLSLFENIAVVSYDIQSRAYWCN